jgi:hypothetical protein
MPVADQLVTSGGNMATPASSAWGVAGILPGTPRTKSTWTLPTERQAARVDESAQRVQVTQLEDLELRHDLALLGQAIEVDHETPRVEEDVVAEVRRAARERAGVGVGVEHPQPGVERVVDAAAGRELHHEIGRLPDRLHGIAQVCRVKRRPMLGVADVDVDEARAGRLAAPRRLDELVERRRQLRDLGLVGLGAGRGDGDEGAGGRGGHAPDIMPSEGRI